MSYTDLIGNKEKEFKDAVAAANINRSGFRVESHESGGFGIYI